MSDYRDTDYVKQRWGSMDNYATITECSICFREPVVHDGKCQECLDWEDYWFSLTPQQQRAELDAMARYTAERASW